jgi:hypothetical protein
LSSTDIGEVIDGHLGSGTIGFGQDGSACTELVFIANGFLLNWKVQLSFLIRSKFPKPYE